MSHRRGRWTMAGSTRSVGMVSVKAATTATALYPGRARFAITARARLMPAPGRARRRSAYLGWATWMSWRRGCSNFFVFNEATSPARMTGDVSGTRGLGSSDFEQVAHRFEHVDVAHDADELLRFGPYDGHRADPVVDE